MHPAVGTRLRVFWVGEKRWFKGVVTKSTTDVDSIVVHQIKYDDGDTKWHNLGEEEATGQLRWLEEAPAPASEPKAAPRSPSKAAPASFSKAKAASSGEWEPLPPAKETDFKLLRLRLVLLSLRVQLHGKGRLRRLLPPVRLVLLPAILCRSKRGLFRR